MTGLEWQVKELTGESVAREIESDGCPVFVDFWAAWCPPCRMMEQVVEELAERFAGKILVRKLNTDRHRSAAAKFNISGIPAFIIFKHGKEVWRHVGALGKKKLTEVFNSIIDE